MNYESMTRDQLMQQIEETKAKMLPYKAWTDASREYQKGLLDDMDELCKAVVALFDKANPEIHQYVMDKMEAAKSKPPIFDEIVTEPDRALAVVDAIVSRNQSLNFREFADMPIAELRKVKQELLCARDVCTCEMHKEFLNSDLELLDAELSRRGFPRSGDNFKTIGKV